MVAQYRLDLVGVCERCRRYGEINQSALTGASWVCLACYLKAQAETPR